MFIQDHPDFVNDPSVSTNLLIRLLATRPAISDIMGVLNTYNVTTPWMGIYALDVAVANGDQNIITLLITQGAVVTDRAGTIARTRQYTVDGSRYSPSMCYDPTSIKICNQIVSLLAAFHTFQPSSAGHGLAQQSVVNDKFELGSVSSFGPKVNELDIPVRPPSFDEYKINLKQNYCCAR